MEKPSYILETSPEGLIYQFESVSQEKIIKKIVCYLPFKDDDNLFELSFGDLKPNGMVDVLSISNNRDMVLIINTVIHTLELFFELYPHKSVVFTGSSTSRNRLYRTVISKYISQNSGKYEVGGLNFDSTSEPFVSNKNYFAFQINLKT